MDVEKHRDAKLHRRSMNRMNEKAIQRYFLLADSS